MSTKLQFQGSLDQLKDKLLPLDLDGDWQEQPNGVWKLKCGDRSGLLWSSTGRTNLVRRAVRCRRGARQPRC